MGLYDAFRDKPASTQYGEVHTTASVDVFDAGLIFAFGVIGFSFLLILPGYMGKEKYAVAVRTFLSIFIGAAILLSNYGMEWERSEIKTDTQYKAFMSQEIKAEVGVKIGLRGVNVTLKGLPVEQKFDDDKVKEHVDYNEVFKWNSPWSQGRLGFGFFASQINNEYHDALHKGTPYPILLIAEYFTLDGESIRWGRSFRLAGYYTQMALWLAFTLWVITNILFLMVIRYGAYFLSITGVVVLLGDLIYDTLHWGPHIVIPFPSGNLNLEYGWCFWLSLTTGFLCLVLGVLIVVLDYFFPGPVATFFNIDIVTEFEEIVEAEDDMRVPGISVVGPDSSDSPSSGEDEAAGETDPNEKRIHFVSKSRYAGISSWHPTKSPLAATKSFPTTTKESVGLNGEASNGDFRRSSSVRINIEQAYCNESFEGDRDDIKPADVVAAREDTGVQSNGRERGDIQTANVVLEAESANGEEEVEDSRTLRTASTEGESSETTNM